MTEHTKEPWRAAGVEVVGDHPQQRYIIAQPFTRGFEGPVLNYGIQEANARRIVACVNALRHVSTEQLETGELLNISQQSADLRRQRDELLAVLERALEGVEGHHPLDADIHSWQADARAAIAKARGKA